MDAQKMYCKKFDLNTKGRDFIVGDIHGSFSLVIKGLKLVKFNKKTDRLFCCGDLVDRGLESEHVLDFLNLPFVHSVRGNHEQMFLDLYKNGSPSEEQIYNSCSQNGMGWWIKLTTAERLKILTAFENLPFAMEIETTRGTIGVVHADVPDNMPWPDFINNLNNPDIQEFCLWSRERLFSNNCTGVQGIGRVYIGHTPQDNGLKKFGNVYAIDTGAVFGYFGNDKSNWLTMMNVTCCTNTLLEKRNPGVLDLLDPEKPLQTPFGEYTFE